MKNITNPIPQDEWDYIYPLETINGAVETMLELGNKKNPDGVYKHFFTQLGVDHTSIDWNGEDGALKMDLTKKIHLSPFDMVTNIGTTEHVHTQSSVWENIHCLTKVGGAIVSVTPYKDYWWWHGEYYPLEEFFEEFCINGYEIEKMEQKQLSPQHVNLYVRLNKLEHNQFAMPAADTMYINKIRTR